MTLVLYFLCFTPGGSREQTVNTSETKLRCYVSMATGRGQGFNLAKRLYVALWEETLVSVEESLTPAVVMVMCQVYDVTLSERQVIGFRGLVAVQHHHFVQVVGGGIGVIIYWWGERWHDVIKATLIIQ